MAPSIGSNLMKLLHGMLHLSSPFFSYPGYKFKLRWMFKMLFDVTQIHRAYQCRVVFFREFRWEIGFKNDFFNHMGFLVELQFNLGGGVIFPATEEKMDGIAVSPPNLPKAGLDVNFIGIIV
jgi:hypothetical protein